MSKETLVATLRKLADDIEAGDTTRILCTPDALRHGSNEISVAGYELLLPETIDTRFLTTKEREERFLIGLAKLTRDTGIIIAGCGCCGSPSLEEGTGAELHDPEAGYGFGWAHEVAWISHADISQWECYSKSIVRPANTIGEI